MRNRVTQDEIGALDMEYRITADKTIPVDPTKLKMLARSNPDQLCYPVVRTGGSGGIPLRAFSGFIKIGKGK